MNQVHVNQETHEALSAVVDGELASSELRFLLRRMEHDTGLRQAWSRYHVIRDGLRGNLPPLASPGFARRVRAAMAHEALPTAAHRTHWLRWSAGGAIAASVAAVTLMIGQPTNDVERVVATQSAPQEVSTPVADAYTARMAAMPSAVPPWLSGGAAGLLSQQASATLGSPFIEVSARQIPRSASSSYVPPLFYRRLPDNRSGSYLLLLDPVQPANAAPRDAAAIAQ